MKILIHTIFNYKLEITIINYLNTFNLFYCNFLKARPIATANSGPVVSKTLSKKTGASILEKGRPISMSARKLFTATSFNPFKRHPPPENIILLTVLLYFSHMLIIHYWFQKRYNLNDF